MSRMAKKVDRRPNKVDDLREILDPGGYQRAAQEGINALKTRLAGLFLDLDLARETPEISSEDRLIVLNQLERAIRDCGWRIRRAEAIVTNSNKPPEAKE